MLVPKTKISFTGVKQLLINIDHTCGSIFLCDSTRKSSVKEYILFKSTVPRLVGIFTFLLITTLTITHFDLLSFILCFSVAATSYGLCACLFSYIANKNIVIKLLNWCESLYDLEKKYPKIIHTMAETELMKIIRKCEKFVKWLKIILYFDSLAVSLGFASVGLFLPENIYPKFSPPLPFYLPFKNQKTCVAFSCNTLVQTLFIVDTGTIAILCYGFVVTNFIHILGFLDIIQKTAEQMKFNMFNNTKKAKEVTTKSVKKPTLNIETLAIINDSLKKSQDDTLTFEEWIQVLNEMISDVNSIITTARKLYGFPILVNELAALGALFVSGLLFTVVRKQYFLAIGAVIVCVLLFIMCFINEKILEKLENINETLYDIPWYNLTPSQIKSLMMLMHCDKIQKGITAMKIHNLTLERFGIIVKAGYTNLLILKDLVQK